MRKLAITLLVVFILMAVLAACTPNNNGDNGTGTGFQLQMQIKCKHLCILTLF